MHQRSLQSETENIRSKTNSFLASCENEVKIASMPQPQLSLRQQQILALARKVGSVEVDNLALAFDVSPQTIRRDLNELSSARQLTRLHGGAIIASGVENLGYEARRNLAAIEKQLIGKHTAAQIPDNSSLFINIGTTTEEVARALVHHQGLRVITNNIHVATILAPCAKIDVIILGGEVRRADGGIVGEAAVDTIRQFKVDHAVMGISAIDDEGALLDFDHREVRAAQAMIENARRVILVADATKFTRAAPVRLGQLTDVDLFVTDQPLPADLQQKCDHAGLRIDIVGSMLANGAQPS
jgi:DeoR family transcriptional regulator, glycerol-3-phosphate regulon repressor